ncbi:MAG: lysine--tRNA ligase [Acidobacteriota bacterium]
MAKIDQELKREEKLAKLKEKGINIFPKNYSKTHSVSDVIREFRNLTLEDLEKNEINLRVPGRIIAIRKMGGASFFHISDGEEKLQGYIRKDMISPEYWELFYLLDIGDIVGIEGKLFRTRTGEMTVLLSSLTFLSKSLHPLPEKWHGLQDVELRYRKRYLDLIVNPEVRKVFEIRSQIIKVIRDFFDRRGYIEVETPMMHPIPGGAIARPFKTYHSALDMELFLRIAPELYLKRLIVGGYEKVYEINRNFRNEGVSFEHNPEFTMLEFYEAYSDYTAYMKLTEELIVELAEKVLGKHEVVFDGNKIEIKLPFKRIPFSDLIERFTGISKKILESEDELTEKAKMICSKEKASKIKTYGKALDALFDEFAKKRLVEPTFVIDFPKELSPLAKSLEDNPRYTERFELVIGGMEVANAFSELNDPVEQRMRLIQQSKLKEKGEEEVHEIDEDFVEALEWGMPPTAGEGIGIDRLVMLFTDRTNIKEVILFPLLRPK